MSASASTAVVAALDFGTSGLKAAFVAADGTVLASVEEPYRTVTREGGVAEQNPDQWWRAAADAMRRLGDHADGVRPAAVSLTGQMQDLVLLDAAGRPVRPALLYSDLRAGDEYEQLAAALPEWNVRTGNVQDASSVAAKVAWLARHEPDALVRAERAVFGPAAAVIARAGGEAVCDVVTASTTGLLDAERGDWAFDVCAAAGLPAAMLPRLLVADAASDSVVGALDAQTARDWGVAAGTPLVAAFGDAGTATDGLVGSEVGGGYVYLGTTGWVARVVERSRLTAVDYLYSLYLPGMTRAIAIGAVLAAGSAAAWARRTFVPHLDFAGADRAVAERLAAVGPEPLLCLPGLGGERAPVRNPEVRGTFVGATDETEPIDLYRAVLTGVAMNLRHVADDTGALADRVPVVGGAARSPAWRQILADVFDRPVVLASDAEPGIRSAARHAARALGWTTVPVPLSHAADADVVSPSPHAERYAHVLPAHRHLYDALAPTFAAVAVASSGGRASAR